MAEQSGWRNKDDKPFESKLYLVWLRNDRGQIGVPPIRIANFNHVDESWKLLPSEMGILDITKDVSNWHDLPVIPPK